MTANIFFLTLELLILSLIAVTLHGLRKRIGLAPTIMYFGGLTAILLFSASYTITVSPSPNFSLYPNSAVMVPVILFIALLIYILDGTEEARAVILSALGLGVLAGIAFASFSIYPVISGSESAGEISQESFIFSPSFRLIFGTIVALAADFLAIILLYQWIKNRGVATILSAGLALLAVLLIDSLITSAIHSPEGYFQTLTGHLIGKFLAGLLLLPVLYFYLRNHHSYEINQPIPIRNPFDVLSKKNGKGIIPFPVSGIEGTHLSDLHGTTLNFDTSQNLSVTLYSIVRRATRLLNAPQGDLYICYPEKKEVHCLLSLDSQQEYTGIVIPYGKGLVGQVAKTGKPLLINNYQYWSGRDPLTGSNTHAALGVPMIWQEVTIGVLGIFHIEEGKTFSLKDVELLSLFAKNAAFALENTRLFEAERSQRKEAEILREVANALTRSLDLETILKFILERLRQIVPFDSASVMLVKNGRLEIAYYLGEGIKEISTVAKYVTVSKENKLEHILEVFEARRPVIIPNTDEDPRWVHFPGSNLIKCWMGIPLIAKNNPIGVLNIDKTTPDFYTSKEADHAIAIANQAAVVIENAKLFSEVQQRAEERETLRQAGAVVAATLNSDEAIDHILVQLDKVVPYDSASVLLFQGEHLLKIVGGRGWPNPEKILGLTFPIPGDNPNTFVVQNGEPFLVHGPEHYGSFQEETHNRIKSWLGVPLKVQNKIIGMLSVDSHQPNFYQNSHARLALAFADQVAIAIDNARLFEDQKKKTEELETLLGISQALARSLDYAHVLSEITRIVVEILDGTSGYISLFEEENDVFRVVSEFYGPDANEKEIVSDLGKTYPVDPEDFDVRSTYNYEVVYANQNFISPSWAEEIKQFGGKTVLWIPLIKQDKWLGELELWDSRTERIFKESEISLGLTIANQAAVAIDNTRLFAITKDAAERREVLHNASQEMVSTSLAPEKIYKAIHDAAARIMPCEVFVITLLNEAENGIDGVYLVDRGGRAPLVQIPIDQGLSGHILKTGEPLLLNDLEKIFSIDSLHFGDPEEVYSILAIPLKLRGKVIGMLSAQSYEPHTYTIDDQDLLEMLGAHAAIALDNARLFAEIQVLAVTDGMTGIANRRAFDEAFHKEMSRAIRYKHPISLVMIDVDDFKQYNDVYGHLAGDERLKDIAALLDELTRDPDLAARFGGDEFILLLPHTKKEGAVQLAERIRNQAAEIAPRNPEIGESVPGYTLSLGVAEFPSDAAGGEDLLQAADNALLKTKSIGKNRVFVANSLLEKKTQKT